MIRILADDGPQVDLTRFLTPQILGFLLIGGAVLIALLAVAALLVVRSARRRKWLDSAAIKRGILSVKAQALPPGAAREIAGLRLELRTALDQTRRSLEKARGGDRPVGELPAILQRVERLADNLDTELALIEGQPDRSQASVRDARRPVDDILQMLAKIRRAAAGALDGSPDGELVVLRADLDQELAALDEGVDVLRRLGPAGA